MKVKERPDRLEDPGIEPVPPERRHLSALDVGFLWGDLGVGLLVLVSGALLVPALGFGTAFSAIVIGSIAGVGLLALGARAGAEQGLPTMALFRPILGDQGSYIPSLLNVAQLIGWTAVELWAMSSVADLVSQRVFGFSARWLWLAIAACVCAAMALWGPIGVARTYMKKFAGWVVLALCLALSLLVLTSDGLSSAIRAEGTGGFPTYGAALDLVIAMPISWLPLVADYTRFARSPRGAAWGTFTGYLIANIWLYSLGALLVLSTGTTPDPAGMAAGILVLAGGWLTGTFLLAGLLVGETDEAFADIYSAAVSVRNVFPRLSQRSLILVITGVSVPLAGLLTMQLYESFLFLIGSIFVPLFGILMAGFISKSTPAPARRGVARAVPHPVGRRFPRLSLDHADRPRLVDRRRDLHRGHSARREPDVVAGIVALIRSCPGAHTRASKDRGTTRRPCSIIARHETR